MFLTNNIISSMSNKFGSNFVLSIDLYNILFIFVSYVIFNIKYLST